MATYSTGGFTFTTTPAGDVFVTGFGITSRGGISMGSARDLTERNFLAAASSPNITDQGREALLNVAPLVGTIQQALLTEANNPPNPQVPGLTSLAEIESRLPASPTDGISPYGEQDDTPDLPNDIDTTVDDTQGYIVPDGTLNIPSDSQILRQPTALGGNFAAQFNVDNQWWEVVDLDTGEVVAQGIQDEAAATILAQDFSVGDPSFAGNANAATDPGLLPEQVQEQALQQATLDRARAQQALKDQQRQQNRADWRVKITLADSADYLYMDPSAGQDSILYPLKVAGGVIFPYTPEISTTYRAQYENYDLTHSNYRGYFYKSSAVEPINISATFTAQDTREANYLLAVIHFFRSATKMFYGAADPNRGTPPPLVFLRGLGQYQFSDAPCVISDFEYRLPTDVDYIRAGSANTAGLQDLNYRRNRAAVSANIFDSAAERLKNAGLPRGAEGNSTNRLTQPDKILEKVPTFGQQDPTYVPTKMDISITLLPMQTRQQVSKEFNFADFASGRLVTRGFW